MQATAKNDKQVHTAVKQAAQAAVKSFSKTAILATYTDKRTAAYCESNIAGRIIKIRLYNMQLSSEMLQAVKIAVKQFDCTAVAYYGALHNHNTYIKILRKF